MKWAKALFLVLTLLLATLLTVTAFSTAEQEEGRIVRVGWVPRENITEVNNGVYSGYNCDYLMTIAEYTGWQYEFVVGDVKTLQNELKSGGIDLLGSLLYTEERALDLSYSALPCGHRYTMLFTSEDSRLEAYDFKAFDGMTVGVLAGDNGVIERLEAFANGSGFKYEILECKTVEELAGAVSDGKADAGAADAYTNRKGYRIIAEFAPVPFYFATAKDNTGLMSELNRALWRMNVDYPFLERELYDLHYDVTFNSELSKRELAIVQKSQENPITVGVVTGSALACYIDETTGELSGIFMEMLRSVSAKTGLQFTYIPLDLSYGAPVSQLNAEKVDIVAGIIRTEKFEEDKFISLTDTLLGDSLVIVG